MTSITEQDLAAACCDGKQCAHTWHLWLHPSEARHILENGVQLPANTMLTEPVPDQREIPDRGA